MAADDSCGPAIDFDNTGCLRISGASLFLFSAFPSVSSFFRSAVLPGTPLLRSFCSLCRSSSVRAPGVSLPSVVCLLSFSAAPIRASNPPSIFGTDAFRHPAKNAKGDPQGAAFGRKGRSAAAYSSAASGRITTFTRLLSSRIFWASFCTSAFETVRMACSPLAT